MKNFQRLSLFFLCFCLFNCGKKKENTTESPADSLQIVTQKAEKIENKQQEVFDKTFRCNKGKFQEYLKIKQIDKSTIEYEVFLGAECDKLIYKGRAILRNGDAETDEDEAGNAFVVDEYVDANKKCGVNLRLGAEEGYKNQARFMVYECETLSCGQAFISQGLILENK